MYTVLCLLCMFDCVICLLYCMCCVCVCFVLFCVNLMCFVFRVLLCRVCVCVSLLYHHSIINSVMIFCVVIIGRVVFVVWL